MFWRKARSDSIVSGKKLSEIEGTAVIYIGEKELEITSDNLNHVNDFPENYALYLELETVEKKKYLKNWKRFLNVIRRSFPDRADSHRLLPACRNGIGHFPSTR